jgi:acyl-CoA oxidase
MPDRPASTVDVGALRRLLDGEHREIRDEVRRQMADPAFALPSPAIPTEEYRELVLKWTRQLASAGDTAIGYPREFGGEGSPGGSVASFEMLGHADLSLLVKVGVQFGLFGGAIQHLGTRRHHEAYLADVATMDLPGCFAMSEAGHGSDVQNLQTTAIYDHANRELVVNTPTDDDHKEWIGNAAEHGRMAAVFCQLVVDGESHGIHCVLVPVRDEKMRVLDGVRIEDCGPKMGLNGVDNGRIWFSDVRVPVDNLLDRYASITEDGTYTSLIEDPDRRFFTMLGTLVQGRVSVAGAGLSAAKSALTIAIRYAERRRQFGPPDGSDETPLLDFRTHQRRLLPRLARTYALHFSQAELTGEFHLVFTSDDADEQRRRQLESWAAGQKAMATWHATNVIQESREACGGQGYLAENRFAELKADTDVFTTFEGDNTVLLQLVAKSLISEFQSDFGKLDPLEMAGFVTSQLVEQVVERASLRQAVERLKDAVPGRDDDAGLHDREWHLELFRWREEHVLGGLMRRLRERIQDRDMDPYDAFLECQDHVVRAARVHVERYLLEAFTRAVDRCTDGPTREALDRLCQLHALAEIERDRGWFQEHGRLSGERAKAVQRAVNDLVTEVRPDAVALVDAFGIPDEVLAPIATN